MLAEAARADGAPSMRAVGVDQAALARKGFERKIKKALVGRAQSEADRPAALKIESVGGDRPPIGLSPLGIEHTVRRCSPRKKNRARAISPRTVTNDVG